MLSYFREETPKLLYDFHGYHISEWGNPRRRPCPPQGRHRLQVGVSIMESLECEHGEPRGSKYCALCRYKQKIEHERLLAATLAAKQEWTDAATLYLINSVCDGLEISADDLINAVGLPSGETVSNGNNAVGALFHKWSHCGFIVEAGRVRSSRASNCGREIRVWKLNKDRNNRG